MVIQAPFLRSEFRTWEDFVLAVKLRPTNCCFEQGYWRLLTIAR